MTSIKADRNDNNKAYQAHLLGGLSLWQRRSVSRKACRATLQRRGKHNPAKRQTPKKFTKAEKQVLQILIRNRRKRTGIS